MKVGGRIRVGYGILLALAAVLAGYQVATVMKVQGILRAAGGSGTRTIEAALETMRMADQLESGIRARLAAPGTQEDKAVEEIIALVEVRLQELQDAANSERLRIQLGRLTSSWSELKKASGIRDSTAAAGATFRLPPATAEPLERFKAQAYSAYQLSLEDMRTAARGALETGQRALAFSWTLLAAAMIIGLLTVFLIIRSITLPLAQLTDGTRAIAEGKAFYRLDTSRDDELGQIAKHFNTLAERIHDESFGSTTSASNVASGAKPRGTGNE